MKLVTSLKHDDSWSVGHKFSSLLFPQAGKPRRRRTCETGQASAVICGKWLLVDQRYFPVSARVLCRQLRPCAEGPLSSATLHLGKTLWCRAGSKNTQERSRRGCRGRRRICRREKESCHVLKGQENVAQRAAQLGQEQPRWNIETIALLKCPL